MSNGLRLQPQKNKKDHFKELETSISNMQVLFKIVQQVIAQNNQNLHKLNKDTSSLFQTVNTLQYRTAAMLELLNVNKESLDRKAEELQTKDFDDQSALDDLERRLRAKDTVTSETDTVVFKTECLESPELSFFRSKIKLTDYNNPTITNAFLNKKAGEVFECKIGDKTHQVTLLGVRFSSEEQTEQKEA